MARVIGRDAKSVLDVGSKKCEYLEWLDWVPNRMSIDLKNPYSSSSVKGIEGDFFGQTFEEKFDLVLCLQVLEHVHDVTTFSQKLLNSGRRLIVSVPYKWNSKWVESHIHDPVDEEKLKQWFGRDPNAYYVVKEPFTKARRLVAYYDTEDVSKVVGKAEIKLRRPF